MRMVWSPGQQDYRGTLPTRNKSPLGLYSGTVPLGPYGSPKGSRLFLMSEVPLYPFAREWRMNGSCPRFASTTRYDCTFLLSLFVLFRSGLFPRGISQDKLD